MRKISLSVLLGMLLVPIVVAQDARFIFEDLANNTWLRFVIIFLLFFAIMVLSLGRVESIKENRGTMMAISAIISLIIAFSIAQTDIFYSYFGSEIGVWVILFAFLIGGILLVKVAFDGLGGVGAGVVLLILWFVLRLYAEPYDFIPSGVSGDVLLLMYETVTSGWGLAGVIILIIIFSYLKKKKGKIPEKK